MELQYSNTEKTEISGVLIPCKPKQNTRVLIENIYYDKDGHFSPSDEKTSVLPVDEISPTAILESLDKNTGCHIEVKEAALKDWIDNEPDESLVICNQPYIRCANSDDFKGTIDIIIRLQSIESHIEYLAMLLKRDIETFHLSDEEE